jgi:hypothetical protein
MSKKTDKEADMARRALLVGINDYLSIKDLRGCHNDVSNIRSILKDYLGFTNNDIRVVLDSRATRKGILTRLEYMADKALPGDYMVFHFSGHGSQIRDRNGDELQDGLDEIICPWENSWDSGFITDDDLDEIFRRIPRGALLEVILDCCHSGPDTGENGMNFRGVFEESPDSVSRYLPPPADIRFRYEGEEESLGDVRGFRSVNRSGSRSTKNHILWAGCQTAQESADAYINGSYNGAFTYYFCKHMRESSGRITRRNLLERIRNSLRHKGYFQTPQLECMNAAAWDAYPFQYIAQQQPQKRRLCLTTPYLRGEDVKQMQKALQSIGYSTEADGVFGPHTHRILVRFQQDNRMTADGVAGDEVFAKLYR